MKSRRRLLTLLSAAAITLSQATARNVTVDATARPAAEVFRDIMEQTDKNFVYPSELLKEMTITIHAVDRPLKQVLEEMFRDSDIEWSIRGRNVVLKRRKEPRRKPAKPDTPKPERSVTMVNELDEVVIVSRPAPPEVSTVEVGSGHLTGEQVLSAPGMFGESDVVRALMSQPGVSEGNEGLSGMYVHGGDANQNQYILDNIPLYHVNHFGGFFSAFNPEIVESVDFYKSSFPVRYDGRLSSFMDVRTRNDRPDRRRGSAHLGLISGSLNLCGPVGERSSYYFGMRRSWYDLLTVPILAIANLDKKDKTNFHYYFMDLNARFNHTFSDRLSSYTSFYLGNDMLKSTYRSTYSYTNGSGEEYDYTDKETMHLQWGNLVVQTGAAYRFSPSLTADFTAAFARTFSSMKYDYRMNDRNEPERTTLNTRNYINDFILRGDFRWRPEANTRVDFGGGYTRHLFMPEKSRRHYESQAVIREMEAEGHTYGADELNAYISCDRDLTATLRADAGVHLSLFHIDSKLYGGVSPRVSVAWHPAQQWAFKGAYSRTVQYVHRLSESYLALPSDRWVPVTGDFKPATADKISLGIYWQSRDDRFRASVEAYDKRMNHLVEYMDEYYLRPPSELWTLRLTSGRGTARGIDFKLEKTSGRLTGHIAYSLARADRTFKEKNFGHTYPARFDNRHSIHLAATWIVSRRVQLSATWTGHSGNRFTLLTQKWEEPGFGSRHPDSAPLRAPLNAYRLPFYHRLDMAMRISSSRGYLTLGLYNAYSHQNTIGVRRSFSTDMSRPVFQKVKFFPVIPSVTYTWIF